MKKTFPFWLPFFIVIPVLMMPFVFGMKGRYHMAPHFPLQLAPLLILIMIGAILWPIRNVLKIVLRSGRQDEAIRQNGMSGTAKILKVTDTKVTVNTAYLVKLQLAVTPSEDASYEVEIETFISRLSVGTIVPGAEIQVKIDRKNRQRVVIV